MNENKAINEMIGIFKNGIKKDIKALGVEFEHFLVDKNTLKSCDYENGVKRVITSLLKKGWEPLNPEAKEILGLSKNGHFITLEPGGQIEISLKPYTAIEDIRSAYTIVRDEIKSTLASNQKLVSLGYHPKSRIDSLDILPKVRYHQMFEYFKNCGKYAHNMMKGTASTQVTIDYFSEEDFIKKFRVANFLSPFFYRVFDSSPIFEGAVYKKDNLRLNIWDNTDQSRCGIPSKALDKNDFDFKDYSEYILDTPPIFLKQNEEYTFTGNQKLKELIKKEQYNNVDIEYILGMVFPDTRLKQYIELRMPDALPYPLSLAVPAMIKGIFYNEKNLDKYYELSLNYDNADYLRIKELFKESLDINHKGISSMNLVEELFTDAMKVLKSEAITELLTIKHLIDSYGSVSNFLKKIYKEDKEKFFLVISGGIQNEE